MLTIPPYHIRRHLAAIKHSAKQDYRKTHATNMSSKHLFGGKMYVGHESFQTSPANFGVTRFWDPAEWTDSDDRVRGGSSQACSLHNLWY